MNVVDNCEIKISQINEKIADLEKNLIEHLDLHENIKNVYFIAKKHNIT
jgi:hypothetical protein